MQIVAGRGETRLYSRTGDDIGHSFPDVVGGLNFDAVLDGELLVVRGGEVASFNDLQQRLNRKSVSRRQLEQFPAHVRLYDALSIAGEDLRELPLRGAPRPARSLVCKDAPASHRPFASHRGRRQGRLA